VLYDNDFANSRFAPLLPPGHSRVENVMMVPLMLDGKPHGLLGLSNKPGGFTAHDCDLGRTFGELVAITLQNSRIMESLETSEERFRSVAQSAADAVVTVDARGSIVFWNNAAERFFGYTVAEALGRPVTLFMPARFHEAHARGMQQAVATGEFRLGGGPLEVTGLRKDGSEFPAELSLARWKSREGAFFTGIFRDITDRKQAEATLQQAHGLLERKVVERTSDLRRVVQALESEIAERRTLEARLLEISEQEQRRIGQDLHDGLCQQLTGIAHFCNVAYRKMAKIAPDQAELGARTVELIQQAVEQAHDLARGLFPVSLEAGGLMAALDELVAGFGKLYPIALRFACQGTALVEDNATATHLYRIAQEAISNACRHAQATEVLVQLSGTPLALELIVTDNGKGLPSNVKSSGLGLETMRFRARSIGAQLELGPGRQNGTVVSCVLPGRQLSTAQRPTYSI
jgi:PAS domain S-box-containing protein